MWGVDGTKKLSDSRYKFFPGTRYIGIKVVPAKKIAGTGVVGTISSMIGICR